MATASNGGGNVSLESAIRTCKVDTSWADKIRSERVLNSDVMVCPLWEGLDLTGRPVCPDSFMTKNAGCNSAEDRVLVENSVVRPQYMEFINLNALGVEGSIYDNTTAQVNTVLRTDGKNELNNFTGQFGYVTQTPAAAIPCRGHGMSAYENAMNQVNNRQHQGANSQYNSAMMRNRSGF